MKKVVLFLLSVFILTGCTQQMDDPEELATDDSNIKDEIVEVIEDEFELKDEEIIVIESTSIPESTPKPIIIETPEPTKVPYKVSYNTPQPTKESDPTTAPVVTAEPNVELESEVVVTPESTIVPTEDPTFVPTPVSTPEPPQQACPRGYNPDWDCGVRIDKAEAFKLFSVAEYGSVEAAFAACDADGQSTNEYNGVEVRSYGCSQQTRNDYGI